MCVALSAHHPESFEAFVHHQLQARLYGVKGSSRQHLTAGQRFELAVAVDQRMRNPRELNLILADAVLAAGQYQFEPIRSRSPRRATVA